MSELEDLRRSRDEALRTLSIKSHVNDALNARIGELVDELAAAKKATEVAYFSRNEAQERANQANRQLREINLKMNNQGDVMTETQTTQVAKHLALLGHKVKDKVTGAEGVVVSVGFDLFGCIQAIIDRGYDKDGKSFPQQWLDVARLEVLTTEPVMQVPNFVIGPQAEGRQGAAEKPHNPRY